MKNNSTTATTTVVTVATEADLSVTKRDSPDPVRVDDELTYTITDTNQGPGTATGITATDRLPSRVALVMNTDREEAMPCQYPGHRHCR